MNTHEVKEKLNSYKEYLDSVDIDGMFPGKALDRHDRNSTDTASSFFSEQCRHFTNIIEGLLEILAEIERKDPRIL